MPSSSSKKKKVSVARRRLRRAKERALQKGLKFNLTFDWLMKRMDKGVCELSGIPFDYESQGSRVPSIDRRDPTKGYTKQNCRIVLWGVNMGLCNWGLDETIIIWKGVMNNAQLIN